MHVTYRLKSFVEIVEEDHSLKLNSESGSLHFSAQFVNSLQFNSHRFITPLSSSDFDQHLFQKLLKLLLKNEWLEIIVAQEIVISECKYEQWLMIKNVSPNLRGGEFKLSSGMLWEVLGEKVRIRIPLLQFSMEISQNLLFETLIKANPLRSLLFDLGIFCELPLPCLSNSLSLAFHQMNSTDHQVVKNPKAQLIHPWQGELNASVPLENTFEQVLEQRISTKVSGCLPSSADLKKLLHTVYGVRIKDKKIKFNYPSAGSSYSVEIFLIYSEGQQNNLYRYNPLTEEFIPRGVNETMNPDLSWVRILLVGKLDELDRRYQDISYRLLLLDAGVLLHQLSIAAAYRGLKGRIIGQTSEAQLRLQFPFGWEAGQLVMAEFVLTK